MRILILGAGLAGVTLAQRLWKDGHEVTVVDRQSSAAAETSFANAGLICPGHAFAWASPQAPLILLKSLVRNDQPLRYRLQPDPAMWRWSLQFLAQCTAGRALRNTWHKHRLCRYGQSALQAVAAETGIAYDGGQGGLLYLYRTPASFARAIDHSQILADGGQEIQVIDREQAAKLEPALAATKDRIAGAIYCPTDERGDACKFTRGLAAWCAERGVAFRFDTRITGLIADGDRLTGVATDQGQLTADAYVMALGVEAPRLTRPLGEPIRVYPIKGYSLTIPIRDGDQPPCLGGVDDDHLVAYARLGDRVRLTAIAEFAGYDTSHQPADFATMLNSARELFPQAGDLSRPSYWACLRPMTPDGLPILGRGRLQNLWYHTGHGSMGWTMACGTARLVADLIAGRAPDLPLDGTQVR